MPEEVAVQGKELPNWSN